MPSLQAHPDFANHPAHRLEVWGYTNQARLRGLNWICLCRLCLCNRDFSTPGVLAKVRCTPSLLKPDPTVELGLLLF
jgi:hypothetical protein